MMQSSTESKLDNLRKFLQSAGKVAIAFSGGVDSAFLAYVALDTLGYSNTIAITAATNIMPEQEIDEARSIAAEIGIHHEIIHLDLLSDTQIASNPPDRCYFCKRTIFSALIQEAEKHGISVVLDGSNADDKSDYRPGMRALKELGVKSPMLEAGLIKDEIRHLSSKFGIKGANRPASPCLPTRIPYGTEITKPVLEQIQRAEAYLRDSGINPVRVRVHGHIARIEASEKHFDTMLQNRDNIASTLREIGFTYVTFDLEGFRSGSMNRDIMETDNDD